MRPRVSLASAIVEIDPELRAILEHAVSGRRCVFVAGLPASGKTHVVRQAAWLASELGRTVHLLRWDVARLAFDTPAILARYPEVGGVTHAAIRLAVGRWARGAVLGWHRAHPDPGHVLVGETPLIGERLMELARPRADELEPLLASDATRFVIPVPTRDVRQAIEGARARDMAEARDARSAPPHLVRSHWDDVERIAAELGVGSARTPGSYDPDLYASTYQVLLRHRHVVIARITTLLRVDVADAGGAAEEIVPSAAEVAAAMAEVERLEPGEVERRAAGWHRV